MVAAAFAFAALAAGWAAWIEYPLGNITRMGGGFVPLVLSMVLLFLSAAAFFMQDEQIEENAQAPKLRACAAFLGGLLIWGLTVNAIGFLAATIIMVALAGIAQPGNNLARALVIAMITALLGYGLFVMAIGVPLTPFGR